MRKREDRAPKYWAFISYSHHDRRVARRLYQEISRRVVPREFRHYAASGSPKFNQIYLYEVESGARSELSSELREALDASRKLIIICSPFAVASGYVAGEIRYFLSLGRSADILCLVASGAPNAADEGHPEFECFPSPLRETTNSDGSVTRIAPAERPLAAAIGQETPAEWRDAVEQLLAGLLGISRGDLNRPGTRTKYAYDADGNETRRLFLGSDGTPVLNQISGRAEARFEYDSGNRLLQEGSFGVHGEPVNRRDAGWFRRVLQYDGSGLLLSQRCFKVSGAAVSPCRNQ
jgi:YD repeat-containing protein